MGEGRDPGRTNLRQDWQAREKAHGSSPRSVLMKGLHPLLNESIDAWHRDVVRAVFGPGSLPDQRDKVLDVGCGFGRLAGEVASAGHVPIGLDFTLGFCKSFAARHRLAVCAEQSRLPFGSGVFGGAYSVTSLMYMDSADVEGTIRELDRCLAKGGVVLILEPCQEFNALIRTLLRSKRNETLAMPGFSVEDFSRFVPAHWQPLAAGHCRWLTAFLPVLTLTTRAPRLFQWVSSIARRLDRPRMNARRAHGRISLYRWIACRKAE